MTASGSEQDKRLPRRSFSGMSRLWISARAGMTAEFDAASYHPLWG